MSDRPNSLVMERLELTRNFLRPRLQGNLGDLLDTVRPAPTEQAAMDLLRDLVDRGALLRTHSVRQAFTLLVLRGASLLSEGQPA